MVVRAECLTNGSVFTPPRFPGISITDAYAAGVELETDNVGLITKIIKQDECTYSVYDIQAKTQYFEGPNDYRATYSQKTQVHREEQYISKWLEWERETSPGGVSKFSITSYMLNYYLAASIACFYGLVAFLAIALCLGSKLCCRRNRVKFSNLDKNPADEMKRTASDDEKHGAFSKDLHEFNRVTELENKWNKKS